MSRALSKSQYCRGRSCLRRLWLYNFRRAHMTPPSDFQEGLFEQGREVGLLARKKFPDGELIHEDYRAPEAALASTDLAIARGARVLFEGAFRFEDVLIRVDILERNIDGSWNLWEVKSSNSLKDYHRPDLAIQIYVLRQLGLQIQRAGVMHLNPEYVRRGALDLDELFQITDLMDELDEELERIPDELNEIRVALDKPEEPAAEIGAVCKNPHACEFTAHCWRDIGPTSIHRLVAILDNKRADLRSLGIKEIADIPQDFPLSLRQRAQYECEKSGQRHVELAPIQAHVAQLQYPLYFLDFETIGYAIPRYEGTRPYLSLPVQYSLHIQTSPGAALRHVDFLYDRDADPRRPLAESLVREIGAVGSVIAYHASFEGARLKELIYNLSDLAPALTSILERLWDLELPFAKRWYVDPNFQGSSSIKKVLPALVPQLSYADLAIQKGDAATRLYATMIRGETDLSTAQKIAHDLRKYCERDTWAMVEILQKLQQVLPTENGA